MTSPVKILELKKTSLKIRETIIRLSEAHAFGLHLGGSLSLAEILTALYFSVAQVDPRNPKWSQRDRIVLSKGHGNVGLLVTLALRGFFPVQALETFNQLGSHFTMHADAQVPGVEHSAGSLGHGLSVAVGMALAGKMDSQAWRVYCLLGDGEAMEGSVWEAIMSAAHFGLANLMAILDRNRLTQEGTTAETMELEPLAEKCRAFGWHTLEVDGHDIEALLEAFNAPPHGRPKMIIASTFKAHGVPSHENKIKSHFAHLTAEQATAALEILEAERARLPDE
jgi:transketolase